MCIQLASPGPGTCFKITPHFSNSLRTKFVSAGENLPRKIENKYSVALTSFGRGGKIFNLKCDKYRQNNKFPKHEKLTIANNEFN